MVKCSMCGRAYAGLSTFTRHTNQCKGKAVTTISCEVCYQQFSTKYKLEEHKLIHQSNDQFVDDAIQTNAAFLNNSSLPASLTLQNELTGEVSELLTCPVCQNMFSREDDYYNHIKECSYATGSLVMVPANFSNLATATDHITENPHASNGMLSAKQINQINAVHESDRVNGLLDDCRVKVEEPNLGQVNNSFEIQQAVNTALLVDNAIQTFKPILLKSTLPSVPFEAPQTPAQPTPQLVEAPQPMPSDQHLTEFLTLSGADTLQLVRVSLYFINHLKSLPDAELSERIFNVFGPTILEDDNMLRFVLRKVGCDEVREEEVRRELRGLVEAMNGHNDLS